MYTYSKPSQTRQGLWTTEVKDQTDRTVLIVNKTTKKSLTDWIKASKQANSIDVR